MRRRLLIYLVSLVVGVLILSYIIVNLDVPETGLGAEIQKIFYMKQARMYLVEEVLEAEHLGSKLTLEVPELPSLSSESVELSQAIALSVFYATILTALMYWKIRVVAVFVGFLIIILLGVLPFELAIESMELDLIIFLLATMIVVEHMRETGVLRYITVKMLKIAKLNPKLVLVYTIILSGLMSALVGEVASIVYITILILEVAELFDINPIPWVITAVFATNIGSAATVIGNPIGVYIALYAGLTFTDFIVWATPSSLIALVAIIGISLKWLKSDIVKARTTMLDVRRAIERGERIEILDEWSAVKNKREFYIAWALFILMVITIALHNYIASGATEFIKDIYDGEVMFPKVLPEAALVLAPLLYAAIALARAGVKARSYVERGVEWWALVFFMFLFANAAALNYTGVTDKLAYLILINSGGEQTIGTTVTALTLISWVTGVTSGFIDNMPVVVALSPVVNTLIEIGLPAGTAPFWGLLLGGCLGGNLTVIGSTANIVAAGILEKYGKELKVGEWLKIGTVVVLITLWLALIPLILRLYM